MFYIIFSAKGTRIVVPMVWYLEPSLETVRMGGCRQDGIAPKEVVQPLSQRAKAELVRFALVPSLARTIIPYRDGQPAFIVRASDRNGAAFRTCGDRVANCVFGQGLDREWRHKTLK